MHLFKIGLCDSLNNADDVTHATMGWCHSLFLAGKEQVTSEGLFLDGLCHSLFSVGKEQVTSVYPKGWRHQKMLRS